MTLTWLLAAAAQAAVGTATAGGTPAAPAVAPAVPAAAAAPAAKADRILCRTEAQIGTRFPRKICFRAGEADERRALDRQYLEQMQGLAFRCGIPAAPAC